MKHNTFLIFIFLISLPIFMLGQRNWELGINFGYLTHNALNLPDDLRSEYSTKSIGANLTIMKNLKLNEKVVFFGGVGLNSYFFEGGSTYVMDNNASHYLLLLYGFKRSILNQKASLNFFFDHNILYSANSVQHNTVFTNVNMGMSYYLSEKWLINTYIPITIYPMFTNKNLGSIDGDILTIYRSGVYNLGIYFGVSYLL